MKQFYKIFLLFSFFIIPLYPQASPYFLTDHYNSYLNYALVAGVIEIDHPLHQPLTCNEIIGCLAVKPAQSPSFVRNWHQRLAREILTFYLPANKNETEGELHFRLGGGYRYHTNTGHNPHQYRMEVYGAYTLPNAVIAHQTVADKAYQIDPLYYGKTSERILGRVENAYLLVTHGRLSFFAGRLNRNWGKIGSQGLLVSDNPYSYDQAGLEIQTKRFRYALYTARLNEIDAVDAYLDTVYNRPANRYWSANRIDFNISPSLKVGLSQAILYGGVGQTFELQYANPAGFYYLTQLNSGVKGNVLYAADIWLKPARKVLLFGQLLMDDLIVNHIPNEDDRAKSPDRLGFFTKCEIADLFTPGILVKFAFTHIGNWTYTTYRNWENYVFHQKSLGYPFNSNESLEIGVDYVGRPPFIFQCGYSIVRQGETNVNTLFEGSKEKFPLGVVEKGQGVKISFQYLPSTHWSIEGSFQTMRRKNADHVPGEDKTETFWKIGVWGIGDFGLKAMTSYEKKVTSDE